MMEFFKGTVTRQDWAVCGGVVAASVVLFAAFLVLVHGSQRAKLQEIIAQDQQVQSDLKTAQSTQQHIDELRAEAAKMQELVTQFEQRLPESREIPTLLKQFEGFAGEIGLRVELSQLPRVTDPRKETIPYSVVARGNFHQIVSFINRLERFQRYLKVSDLNLGKEEEGVAQATFTLSTFRFLQPSEASAKPAEAKKS
jgi:type IV pilus assembly protein PilO